jgi:hypothetical protein
VISAGPITIDPEKREARVHGDLLLLDKPCRKLIRSLGFEPWGNGGWVRDDEGGDTCYDDIWALRHAVEMSPLPDGTMVEAEPVGWDALAAQAGVSAWWETADGPTRVGLTRGDVVAAFNSKHGSDPSTSGSSEHAETGAVGPTNPKPEGGES